MRRLALTLALTLSIGLSTHAQDKAYKPLDTEALKSLLSGNTIRGEYRFMRARTKTYKFTEAHTESGTTAYKEGPIEADGIWYTLGENKVCYKYPNQPEMGGTSCFWVYNDDGCYYGYGLSEMTLTGPRSFDDWSARWVIDGSHNSCDAPIT